MKICTEILTLDGLQEHFNNEIPSISNDEWCYVYHIHDTVDLPPLMAPAEFLEFCSTAPDLIKGYCDETLFIYSVNSQEDRYEEWVQLAYDIPGASVTVVDRGNRFVYFCVVPAIPNLGE